MTTTTLLTALFILTFLTRFRHHVRPKQQHNLPMTWVIPITTIEAMLLTSLLYATAMTAALIIVQSTH